MNIITKINWVDILVIIILFRVTYVAFQSGLSHEIFPLFATAGTLVLSLHYYHPIAVFLNQNAMRLPVQLLDLLSFLVLLLGLGIVFKFIGVFVDKVIKVTWHPVVEKFGGLVIGMLRACVVASIVLAILVLIPLPYLQKSIRDRSMTGMYFLGIGPGIYSKVSRILPTMKIEPSAVAGEDVIKRLISDKKLELNTGTAR